MQALELILLVLAYTTIILALFLEIICYRRNLEMRETIYLTVSLLLLIVALTLPYFLANLPEDPFSMPVTQAAMILVGHATIVNILVERKHNLPKALRQGVSVVAALLGGAVLVSLFATPWPWLQYTIAGFMGGAVVFSMLMVRRTQPVTRIAHLEKSERIFSILLMVVIPGSLLVNFLAPESRVYSIGLTIPLVFILLASNKAWDDLQRLSLLHKDTPMPREVLTPYGLTTREQEIAQLLIKGSTYRAISEELHISIPTVKTHVTNLYRKCQVNNKIELINLTSR
ncbi:MAG: LuxR C-terminal-related transcriptional regulator [Bacteroidota bacterium]